MSSQWEDLLRSQSEKQQTPSSMLYEDDAFREISVDDWSDLEWLDDEEDNSHNLSIKNENEKDKKKIKKFFNQKWRFVSPKNNPYSVPEKNADQIKDLLPEVKTNLRPVIDESIYENPVFSGEISWNWLTVIALGASQNRQRGSEEKLPKEFAAIAGQLASGHQAFALACVGCSEGGAKFGIGQLEKALSIDNSRIGNLLRSSFGIAELKKEEDINCSRYRGRWKQAKCVPVRIDTEILDKMTLPLDPGNWADFAASVVCDTDCALCLEFLPIEHQTEESLKEKLRNAHDAEDAMMHYLKDTQQISGNYGISGSVGKNLNQGQMKAPLWQRWSRSYNSNFSYNEAQGISKNAETRDYEAEQMQKRLQNRIRLLEQMLTLKNGWSVRITISMLTSNYQTVGALCGIIGSAFQKIGYTCHWESGDVYGIQPRSSVLLPDYLLPPLISFPQHSFIGFELKPRPNLNLNPELPQLNNHEKEAGIKIEDISLPIGTLVWNGKESKQIVRIPKKEINRHMFVCGKTGSGKSNTVTSFLTELQNSLHYLVIEPVKGEYHALPGIRRYNMVAGDQEYCLQMNPFWFPDGSSLQYHVDSLKLIISAAFDLYAAMPNILEQCLYRVYVNCGWDFVSGKNMYAGKLPEEYLFPTFQSLCDEVEQYLHESAFGDETQGDYEGALLSRLQSFTSGIKGLLLNTNKHAPIQDWAEKNVVVELDALADDADKAIVMGALLIQYFQYVKYIKHVNDPEGVNKLEHLFVLEEAHHLFKEKAPKTSSSGKGSGGSSSTQLVEMLDNLLAEARCYGEGFIIVDQSPSNVSTSVLKNTGVKIVHRSDYGDDVDMLRRALLLDEKDKTTAYLGIGRALVRYGTMPSPCEVKIKLCEEKEKSKMHPATSQLSAVENAYDRILSNKEIMNEVQDRIPAFVVQILAEEDLSVVLEMYETFRLWTSNLISFKCGVDYAERFSSDDYYLPILQACVNQYTQELFPGQFCLSKMITLFIIRFAKILSYYRKIECVDGHGNVRLMETIKKLSENQKLQKDWDVLKNYRSNQIHSRMEDFYKNDETITTSIVLHCCEENHKYFHDIVPDLPVISGLVTEIDEKGNGQLAIYECEKTEDGEIAFSEETEQKFTNKLNQIVFVLETSRVLLWKDYVLLVQKFLYGSE